MGNDYRLYVIEPGWRVAVKPDDGRQLYCYLRDEELDAYPRIAAGEIYVTNDEEVYSLNAAVRKGIVTPTRPTLGARTPSES